MSGLKIACLMMQKNEGKLLEAWLNYYTKTFGISNLFVYDNGSTDPYTVEVLDRFEVAGLTLYRQYATKKDFENKGNLFSSKIKELEVIGEYDFFFPLDCDEFLGCELEDGSVSLEKIKIDLSLNEFIKSQDVLYIKQEYNNHPARRDYYLPRDLQRKSFFAADACESLDMGYHDGKAKHSTRQTKTRIVYVHFHNKPYELYQASAREKLIGRVSDFSVETLEQHLKERKLGFHLIPYLLMSEHEYVNSFRSDGYKYIPQLRRIATSDDSRSFFDAIPSDKCNGCVDHLSIKDGSVRVIGWAVDGAMNRWEEITATKSGTPIEQEHITRLARPDVVKVGLSNDENCGFDIRLKGIEPSDQFLVFVNEFTALPMLKE